MAAQKNDSEVERLKALVENLEQQNTLLKQAQRDMTHQHSPGSSATAATDLSTADSSTLTSRIRSGLAKLVNQTDSGIDIYSLLDDDLIDLEKLDTLEDDENWLYGPSEAASHTNIVSWLRQDIDSLDVAAKRNLAKKIEKLIKNNRSARNNEGGKADKHVAWKDASRDTPAANQQTAAINDRSPAANQRAPPTMTSSYKARSDSPAGKADRRQPSPGTSAPRRPRNLPSPAVPIPRAPASTPVTDQLHIQTSSCMASLPGHSPTSSSHLAIARTQSGDSQSGAMSPRLTDCAIDLHQNLHDIQKSALRQEADLRQFLQTMTLNRRRKSSEKSLHSPQTDELPDSRLSNGTAGAARPRTSVDGGALTPNRTRSPVGLQNGRGAARPVDVRRLVQQSGPGVSSPDSGLVEKSFAPSITDEQPPDVISPAGSVTRLATLSPTPPSSGVGSARTRQSRLPVPGSRLPTPARGSGLPRPGRGGLRTPHASKSPVTPPAPALQTPPTSVQPDDWMDGCF